MCPKNPRYKPPENQSIDIAQIDKIDSRSPLLCSTNSLPIHSKSISPILRNSFTHPSSDNILESPIRSKSISPRIRTPEQIINNREISRRNYKRRVSYKENVNSFCKLINKKLILHDFFYRFQMIKRII